MKKKSRLYTWGLLVILSLFVHLILLLIFSIIQQQHPLFSFFQNTEQSPAHVVMYDEQPTPDEIPFMLNLKENSSFGTTVMFEEEPVIASEQKTTDEVSNDTTTEDDSDSHGVEHQEQEKPLTLDSATVNPSAHPPARPDPAHPSAFAMAMADTWRRRVEGFERQNKKKRARSPITLAAFTQGFLDYVKVSSDEIDINSNDLIYAQYNQRIAWFLQNSFNIRNRPITLESGIQLSIVMHLTIDRTGALLSYTTTPAIPAKILADHIQKVVHYAQPFPRMPNSLPHNPYKIKIPLYIEARAGTHSYHFQFRG